jgi:transposase
VVIKKIEQDLENKALTLVPKEEKVILEPKEWLVIALSQKQLSLSEIVKKTNIDINTVLKIANKLEEKGLAELKEKIVIIAEGKKNVPPLFWEVLKRELATFIGPIAEIIVEDEIKALKEKKEDFPYEKLSILVEQVSKEIDNPAKIKAFKKRMIKLLKRI